MIRKSIVFLSLCFMGTGVWAESSPEVSAQVYVRPSQVLLGQEFIAVIKVSADAGVSIGTPLKNIPIEPFEIKSVELLSENKKAGTIEKVFKLTMVCFDLGDWPLPPIVIPMKIGGKDQQASFSGQYTLKVEPMPNGPKEKDDIKPLKGPASIGTRSLLYISLGILITILLGVLAWRLHRLYQVYKNPDENKMPPGKRFFRELNRLESQGSPTLRPKEYWAELSLIVRRFLERKLSMEALEKTSVELMQDLSSGAYASSEDRAKFRSFFEKADLVKFANEDTDKRILDEHIAFLKQWVSALCVDEEKKKKR